MKRLLGSFSFRLALIYAALFTLSLAILLGFYFWTAIHRPMEDVRAGLEAEAGALGQVYATGGESALRSALERRAAEVSPRQAYHALLEPGGRALTSNLPSWPNVSEARWHRIEADVYRGGDEHDHEALVLDLALPNGERLLLGRDIEDLDDIGEAIVDAASWFIPALLLLVIAGGALMSRAIGKRIDGMGATARRIMDGHHSERIPVNGSQDDFDRLGGTLNAMLDRIEASLDAVRRVSDSVAHELRTPLTRLQADLAELRDAPDDRRIELTEHAEKEAQRLGRMFDAVLRITRIESGRGRSEMRIVDLAALIHDAIDYYAPQAEAGCLSLTADVVSPLSIEGDPDLLFQAISNLLDNAVKFTPEGGRIAVSAHMNDGTVSVRLVDSGPGVAAEFLEKVGERFFRAPEAAAIPGFGLGLAFVHAVAARHNSSIELANTSPGLAIEWRFSPTRRAIALPSGG